MECSKEMQQYFNNIEKDSLKIFEIANELRKKGYDPEDNVEITLAKNMAERVIGLISVVAPQLKESTAVKRIMELEAEYGILDWRVALKIAEEIAKEKFVKFKDQKEAIEVGIRTGFAYVTVGVVSSPLEGFTSLEIKNRLDGQGQYFCLNFAGPIRNAGGTAASVCVIIGDYLRKIFGYGVYDPNEQEIKRCYRELEDYHEFVTNLQYFPSEKETEFLVKNLPVEISGEPSEKYTVSNYKDLPRVPTNFLRSGYCLIHSSCIPLKAPKLWKQIQKWGKEFQLDHWNFLEEFLKIQKSAKAKLKKEVAKGITPDFTYIHDLVAGRPVLGHPLRNGAFRLRFGRSRVSGYSSQSIHPATMHILNNFIASATQLKVERPGKATAISVCDSIDGPIVKLKDGSVYFLETEALAKKYKEDIQEIIYLGDILINYGDFFDRAHPLVSPGYCQEWWVLEFEKALIEMFGSLDYIKASEYLNIQTEKIELLIKNPIKTKLSVDAALEISKKLNIPLHPLYTFFWKSISKSNLIELLMELPNFNIIKTRDVLEKSTLEITERNKDVKRTLELLGIEHSFVNNTFVVINKNNTIALLESLGIDIDNTRDIEISLHKLEKSGLEDTLSIINLISNVKIKDKCGIFIGSRMGRPEKAKMRKMTGSPHVLFPVGEEGGKMRSFQSTLEKGNIIADFSIFKCEKCNKEVVFRRCPFCDSKAIPLQQNQVRNEQINIREYFDAILKNTETTIFPDLIKGVRGTSNKEHIPEHLLKGFLRAKYDIYVNKDGTTRYDASELVITHFKPKEIGVSIEKLKKLGYTKDINGNNLDDNDQILELKPQDVILPACVESPDEPCDVVLFRTTKFIDDLLVSLYKSKPFYNIKTKEDLIGHLIVGLAPHTSAGIVGRIIGFSKTQGFYAQPIFHAAMRRDADGDESCVLLLMDALLNFSKHYLPNSRGATMDAPLVLTYLLNPTEVDDMAFHVDIAWKYTLEFYKACEVGKMPWEVNIKLLADVLNTPEQFEGYGYTHETEDINQGVLCSQYKLLPTMEEKLKGQMDLAKRLRCVDETDVARLVIEKHFLRDIRGNLRKFSTQQFRCVNCNEKYRRPPLSGNCLKCKGRIIFTITEGSILKYLEPSLSIAKEFNVPVYLQQSLELTKRMVESYFGKDPERQEGLGKWFGEEELKK
ncbi:MAG: DNA polymerase II large subunit [Candidatus Woesearchaeota archaeon]